MSRSQESFQKKSREKERAKKKQDKRDKREARRDTDTSGLEIDWSSAPQNLTLSKDEVEKRANTQSNSLNK